MIRRYSFLLLLVALVAGGYSSVASAAPASHVTLSVSAPPHLDANNSVSLTLTFSNPADLAATDVQADIALLVAGRVASVSADGWSCLNVDFGAPGTLRCTTPRIDAHGSSTIALTARYGQPYLRETVLANVGQAPNGLFATITRDATFYRTFEVTTTADSGAGSLRQVINDVNSQCTSFQVHIPCSIAFAVPGPVPAEGWYTIEPLSPLPAISANDVQIDGEAQTALTGDTNPLGPVVFLRGDHAGAADGLSLQCGACVVHGLAIGGFAQNGIAIARLVDGFPQSINATIERNYIGVDPTGSHAVPNALRGINALSFKGSEITGNVIGGNGRSGIAIDDADFAAVTNNRIGVAAHSDDPVPNGASGIFFTNTSPYSPVRIEGNVVEYNADFGIAVSANSRVSILENLVAHNHNQAIDFGLDGRLTGAEPPPVIESAIFDGASGETAIAGRGQLTGLVSTYEQVVTLYLYANIAPIAEGERFIGKVTTDVNGRFSLRVKGDLRGSWITGTTDYVIDFHDYVNRNASEFSAPFAVGERGRRRLVRP